jgi:hypothetical protein
MFPWCRGDGPPRHRCTRASRRRTVARPPAADHGVGSGDPCPAVVRPRSRRLPRPPRTARRPPPRVEVVGQGGATGRGRVQEKGLESCGREHRRVSGLAWRSTSSQARYSSTGAARPRWTSGWAATPASAQGPVISCRAPASNGTFRRPRARPWNGSVRKPPHASSSIRACQPMPNICTLRARGEREATHGHSRRGVDGAGAGACPLRDWEARAGVCQLLRVGSRGVPPLVGEDDALAAPPAPRTSVVGPRRAGDRWHRRRQHRPVDVVEESGPLQALDRAAVQCMKTVSESAGACQYPSMTARRGHRPVWAGGHKPRYLLTDADSAPASGGGPPHAGGGEFVGEALHGDEHLFRGDPSMRAERRCQDGELLEAPPDRLRLTQQGSPRRISVAPPTGFAPPAGSSVGWRGRAHPARARLVKEGAEPGLLSVVHAVARAGNSGSNVRRQPVAAQRSPPGRIRRSA